MSQTYYKMLNVKPNASKEDLLKALKNRINNVKLIYDGDVEKVQKHIDALLDCYNTLANPERKALYDKKLYLQRQAIQNQKEALEYEQKLNMYILMRNPAKFYIKRPDNSVILVGYYINQEDQELFFAETKKVKVNVRKSIQNK